MCRFWSYQTSARMPLQLITASKKSRSDHFLASALVFTICMFSNYESVSAADMQHISVGAIVDVTTRAGKEIKAATEIAAQNFNKLALNQKLDIHFRNPGENPLHTAYAALELIQEKDVQAIIGMKTWEETALVAGLGNQTKVPIISFAASAVDPSIRKQWPFLFQIASDVTEQIRCITYIIGSFNWRKVIALYEVDSYGGDFGIYAALSEALQNVGVEIEYRVVFPPYSSLSDPNSYVNEAMASLLSKQSRVFVILQSSLSLAVHIFREAKKLRISGKHSVWIVTEPLAGHLDSVDDSVISYMDGAIGLMTSFSEETSLFLEFKHQFKQYFQSEYPEEDNYSIGIHALRAYDSITAITDATEKLHNGSIIPSDLRRMILSSNFTGLCGKISFSSNGLLEQPSILRILNFIGMRYKELGLWSSKLGFLRSLSNEESLEEEDGGTSIASLATWVNWPGDLKQVPKGWSMPNDIYPLKIGVPGRTSFEKFVKVKWNATTNNWSYSGYCIDIFFEVLKVLEQSYPVPYEFYPLNGTYDELVNFVANKTVDAVVGDVTILANRSKYVEFTQPFAESGLTMVVTVKSEAENNAWILLKPFTKEMWAVTGLILIYTVFIVWLLERQSNPEFEGPWWHQLCTAFCFIFSSLFFAHREKMHSSYTRAVMLVWLFIVFTLTTSYTASLSSMLTVPRLQPNVTDIEWLKKSNAKIGCDGDSFVRKYLEEVLHFKPENIEIVDSEYKYPAEFENGKITAAFLELPHMKAFLNEYCKGYTVAENTTRLGGDRFGGLGFVFQKGSPIALDVSQAILTLSENGKLKELEIEYFSPSPKCSHISNDTDSLNWQSFSGLYLLSALISTICYLLFTFHQIYSHWREERS